MSVDKMTLEMTPESTQADQLEDRSTPTEAPGGVGVAEPPPGFTPPKATYRKGDFSVVISGVSGRFPESATVDEFAENLFANLDLFTEDNRRWPTELYDMNQRMGKIPDIEQFDGKFFNYGLYGGAIDPGARILLETTYEAICDAGVNPSSLRGSSTGVYVGISTIGLPDGLPNIVDPLSASSHYENMSTMNGCAKNMYANRLSYFFDFRGPSMTIDTACSASMVALDTAVTDLLVGKVEQAIVAGAHVNLQSFTSYNMQQSRIVSRDGISKVWDIDADGFVKGEAVVSLFLQRQPEAKRIYARVLHIRTNIDGYKKGGPTYPSSERQRDLLIQTYTEANIHPNDLTYFEAHGTGTKIGDFQEASAIQQAYQARSKPLPIGLLKSNIGHTEGTAGVASVVKVCIAYERECIPANLNMKMIKPEIKELTLLQSVTSNLKYSPGIVGVNSSGIGGVNGHALLEPNYKVSSKTAEKVPIATVSLPRLVPLHGRTKDAVEHLMSFIEGNPDKITPDFLGLIADVFKSKTLVYSDGFPYRGALLITSEQVNGESKLTYSRSAIESVNQQVATPLCFFYSGIGGQAGGLAKNLTSFNWFMDKLTPLAAFMQPYGVDLIHLLTSESAEGVIANSLVAKFVSTTAFQLILTDLLLNDLHLVPDCTLGHSFGEISAAFAKGFISAEEALLVSYHRGVVLEEARDNIPLGLMAAVGMSANDAAEQCPESVFLACDNAPKLVTLSGEETAMKSFLARLSEDGIFVRQLDSAQFPLHTPFLNVIKEQLFERLSSVFTLTRQIAPSLASSDTCKWISTSQTAQFMQQLQGKRNASESFAILLAQYFVDNLLQPVQFKGAIESLDDSTVVLEIAGRELFEKVLTKGAKPLKYVPLLRGNARSAQGLLTNLGALYRQGFNPSIERLYPAVQWPVPRGTASISSLLKWDHSESFHVKRSPDYYFKGTASDLLVEIDPKVPEFSYLYDHIIDGHAICPGAFYLHLAWKRLAESRALPWTKVAVQFEQVQLKRAVFLDRTKVTTLKVRLLYPSGEFTLFEGENVCCTGLVRELPPGRLLEQGSLEKADQLEARMLLLGHEDLYANMRIRGYEYGRQFCHLMSYSSDYERHAIARIRWTGQIVNFLDHMIQAINAITAVREVFVPFLIPTLKIDPKIFFAAVEQRKQLNTKLKKVAPEVSSFFLGSSEMSQQKEKEKVITTEGKTATEILIPVYRSLPTEATVAPGIEMSQVASIMLNRAMHPRPVLVDRHLFLGNHETLLLGKVATDNLDRKHYEKLTTLAFNRLLKEFDSKIASIPFLHKTSVKEMSEETLGEQFQNRKQASLFKMVQDSFEKSREQQGKEAREKDLSSLLGESALKLSSSLAGTFEVTEPSLVKRHLLAYVHSDLLSTLTYTECLLRPLVDLVAENFAFAKKFIILQMSPVSAVPLALKVDNYLASTCVLKKAIDYTLVSPQTDAEVPLSFVKQNWSIPQEPLWPEGLPFNEEVQCTILYDDPFLQELQLTSGHFWEKVSQLLTPTGFTLLLLRSKLSPIERFLCESIFRESMPTDENLQERVKQICLCAQEAGFISVASKSSSSGQMALLFRKKQPVDASFSVITLKSHTFVWLEEVKEKLAKIENGSQEIIWLLADGQAFPGALGFFNCLRQEFEGKQFCLLFLPNAPQGQAEQEFSQQKENLLLASLAVNVVQKGVLGTYRHLRTKVFTGSRLSREYHLNFGSNGYELANLALYDLTDHASNSSVPRIDAPPPLERKYAVYSAGINFRDLMFASGRLRPNFEMLQLNCILGSEFAGRDCETGDRMFGFDLGGSFASSTWVEPALVRPIPPHWSYEDAAGIPTIYFTVWYGLIYRARLQRGSTVLIHSAAGGVGQAALNVCKAYDCTIYATVGNAEKRKFLTDQFSIPPEHIFSSRDCMFEREIRSLTGGTGVKYVFNSLVGEMLDASLRLVAYNGHFIELAKVELAMNKRIGTFPFLSNISYHGVSNDFELNAFGKKRSPVMGLFFDWLLGNCAPKQAVQPVKTQVYPIEEGATALRLMASGKHIGKIVLRLPREEEDSAHSGTLVAPCKPLSVQTMTHFDPRKVYILVGGCGGVGLELAHWMVQRGAKQIVLTSRSSSRTVYQSTVLRVLAKKGVKYPTHSNEITVYSEGDLSKEEDCREMVKQLSSNGSTIGGIFHLATQLNDVPLKGMTPELWQKTVDSKATIGLNLDRVSRELLPQLDYFVCFSSISAALGHVGQANYGYANSALDQICEQRREDGLHGLSFQYGPIGDVGLLRDKIGSFEMTILNVTPQRIRSCLDVLGRALASDCSVLSSFVYANRSHESALKDGVSRLAKMCIVMRINLDTLPDSLPLEELGLDSLFAIELQTAFEQEFAINITLPEIMSMTIGQLKSARQKENHETIKRQLREAGQLKKYLNSLSYTLASSPLEPLNSGKDGPPLYLLPGGLSLTPSVRALAGKLNVPVLALNLTPKLVASTQLSTVHSIATYYRKVLLAENPARRHFNLLAFDASSPLALAIISSDPGLSSYKLCVIEKETTTAWGQGSSEQDDAVIDHLVGSLLAGSGQGEDTVAIQKERLLRSIKKEESLEGKVKALSGLLISYQLNKEKGEDVEAFIDASVRQVQIIAQEERKLSEKKESLPERWLTTLAKTKSQLLLLRDGRSPAHLSTNLKSMGENSSTESTLIKLHQLHFEENAVAEMLNKFYQV